MTTWQSVLSYRKRQGTATLSNESLDGWPNTLCFCAILKQISHGHQYPDELFACLADFKLTIEKARKRAHHELLHNTPGSPSTKLLIAATATRADRNRHLGILMRCCAAWEPVGKCFDQGSFECLDFHGLSQIASLTWLNGRQRCTTYLGLRRKKTTPGPNADSACERGERHPTHETVLEHVQKAREGIQWKIHKQEFDEMIATKKESGWPWTRWYSLWYLQVCWWIGVPCLV